MNFGLNKLSNLAQRTIAGSIGAAVIIFSVCFNQWTYFTLFFGVCLLSLVEFYKLLDKADIKPNKAFGITSGIIIYSLIYLIESKVLNFEFYYLLFPFLFLLFLIELFQNNDKPFVNIAFTFLGNIYIAFPFGLLHASAFTFGNYHYEIILGILFLIWANDIGGYFSGRMIGKNKLFFRVSPKKTWEGSIGGALFAMAIGLGLSLFYKSLSPLEWLVMSVLIVVIGSCGDLVESLLKRSLSIKDSGDLIPGHGGFLDRFDSLLLSSPFIAAFLKIISINF